MFFDQDLLKITVIQNGNSKNTCEIEVTSNMTFKEVIKEIAKKLKLKHRSKCRLFDASGDEITNEDIEYLKSDQIIFISQGEDFINSASLSLYEYVRNLGVGGFGAVKLYRHRKTKEEVAIKFMETKGLSSTEEVDQVFTEINVLRKLQHPNIIQIKDSFMTEHQICIVMEYCKGGELKTYIYKQEDQKVPEKTAINFAKQITQAINCCHQHQIIHRDLKLENILMLNDLSMTLKIVDFGIAGMFKFGSENEKSEAGSLNYVPPEVFKRNENALGPALDVWAMGCIFYALLMGALPFSGTDEETVRSNICKGSYEPLELGFVPS